MDSTCPFCKLRDERCVLVNQHVRAFRDAFPISNGHTLIISRRHAASIFDLDEEEQTAIWSTASIIRQQLQQEFAPDAFNIGMNDGAAAGQTVRHAHLHVIPRYAGDVADPRGGMRWVVPSLADYRSRSR